MKLVFHSVQSRNFLHYDKDGKIERRLPRKTAVVASFPNEPLVRLQIRSKGVHPAQRQTPPICPRAWWVQSGGWARAIPHQSLLQATQRENRSSGLGYEYDDWDKRSWGTRNRTGLGNAPGEYWTTLAKPIWRRGSRCRWAWPGSRCHSQAPTYHDTCCCGRLGSAWSSAGGVQVSPMPEAIWTIEQLPRWVSF